MDKDNSDSSDFPKIDLRTYYSTFNWDEKAKELKSNLNSDQNITDQDASGLFIKSYAKFSSFIKSENSTFILLALMELIGQETLLELFSISPDIKTATELALELCRDDQEKHELVEMAFSLINIDFVDIEKSIELLQKIKGENYKSLLQLSFWHTFRSDDFNPNADVNNLAIRLLDLHAGNELIDLCSGQGHFLESSFLAINNLHLYGQEINSFNYFVSRFRLYISGSKAYTIKKGDVLNEPLFIDGDHLKTFDRVYTNFPFLQKIDFEKATANTINWQNYPLNFSPNVTTDWLFVGLALNMMKPGGKAVAIVSNGALRKITDREIRMKLVQDGRIEAIIQLPRNVFSFTNIETSMIVFSQGNKSIKMIDASKIISGLNSFTNFDDDDTVKLLELYRSSEDSENCRTISIETIKQNDYNLSVAQYLEYDSIHVLSPIKMSSIAQKIFRGSQIKAEDIEKLAELIQVLRTLIIS
jgi:type I restriction-modification system DNA methylase subunit